MNGAAECLGHPLFRAHQDIRGGSHRPADQDRLALRQPAFLVLASAQKALVHWGSAAANQALGWILAARGLPVIAHPARYRLTRSKLARLIGEFRAAGGVGIEVVSGSHTLDETRHMAAVSREHHLLASAGSDYHGPHNPWVELGRLRDLPQGCIPVWEAADSPSAA